MRKVIIIILAAILLFPVILSGQLSTRQAGLRMGYRSGIFFQASSESGNAEIGYNAMLSFYNNGIQITGLRIVYENSLSGISPNLFLGWGYGGHAGFVYTDHLQQLGDDYYFQGRRFCPLIGIDGWLAAEYRIQDMPIIISLNLKPYLEITIPAFVRFMPADFGISVSYMF
jgi:hypothetical protein